MGVAKKPVVATKRVAKVATKPKPKPKTIVYKPKLDPKVAAYRSKLKSKLAASRKKTQKIAAGTIKITAGKSKSYQLYADPYTKSSYKASALLGSTTRGPPADPGIVTSANEGAFMRSRFVPCVGGDMCIE